MRRIILSVTIATLFVLGSSTFVGCWGSDHQNRDDQDKQIDVDQKESADHAHYQCPMDCEEGKVYEEPGSCPVCKMDLKEVDVAHKA